LDAYKSSLLIYRYSFPLVGCTQIFNIEMKQKDINEDVVFWKWVSETTIRMVTNTSVSIGPSQTRCLLRRKSPTIMLHFLVPKQLTHVFPPDVPNIFLFSSSCLADISYSDNITNVICLCSSAVSNMGDGLMM